MNIWTELSMEFAQQRNYLDELYKVYPISPNLRRELPSDKEDSVRQAFCDKDNISLLRELLSLDVFPLKDSYIPFLRKDRTAIDRNPQTVNRIAGSLYQMGIDDVLDRCTAPKETNRQIGPMFKRWIKTGVLGVPILESSDEFLAFRGNCVYDASDKNQEDFAKNYLGYTRNKGLDFISKFNGKYVIAETKFITDFGGHQNAQFEDAINTINTPIRNKFVSNEVIAVAIMDGVLYIKSSNKMYKFFCANPDKTILSSLLLREFLYSL